MKNIALITLTICLLTPFTAFSQTENWCGTYAERNGQAYIRISSEDIGVGSSACSLRKYNKSISKNGSIHIPLSFNKKRSTLNNWRKFSGHLIEIRGKLRNGNIAGARFIRDMGS